NIQYTHPPGSLASERHSMMLLPSRLAVTVLLVGVVPAAFSQDKISYRRDVAPILRRHCTSCHTKADPQGELNMESVKLFIQGGKNGAAIKAGKPDESLAILMVTGIKKPVMPHKQPPLSPAKVLTLRQWISAGAKDDSEGATVVDKIVIPKSYRVAPSVT